MTETLVKLQTAKLAKQKGFNVTVKHRYRKDEADMHLMPYLAAINFNDPCFQDEGRQYTSAPSQTILQKWLREVHNVIVFVAPVVPHCKEFGYTIVHHESSYSKLTEVDCSQFYDNYELTLETGLEESLKLLPDVK